MDRTKRGDVERKDDDKQLFGESTKERNGDEQPQTTRDRGVSPGDDSGDDQLGEIA